MPEEKSITEQPFPHTLAYQLAQKLLALGQAALDLHRAGNLPPGDLTPLCAELLALEGALLAASAPLPAPPAPPEPAPEPVVEAVPPPPAADELSPPPPIEATAVSPSPAAPSTCPQCGTLIAPGKKFCTTCGQPLHPEAIAATVPFTPPIAPGAPPVADAPLPVQPPTFSGICPDCGTPAQPDQTFCTNCGCVLQPADPLHVAPTASSNPPDALEFVSPPAAAFDKYCDNCGLAVAAHVTICPTCGGQSFSV